MEADNESTGAVPRDPASPDTAHTPPNHSRKIAWAVAVLLAASAIGATVWAVQAWQTNRAIAGVESSLASRPLPTSPAGGPAAGAPLAPGGLASPPEPAAAVATAPAQPSGDRLPPLIVPKQSVPPAVLRDLPDWVAAQVSPMQTSGGSGDESAAPAARQQPAGTQRQRAEAITGGEGQAGRERRDRYGAVFARCPGPGESGAVECRRAVCDGAAKKSAACAPYLK